MTFMKIGRGRVAALSMCGLLALSGCGEGASSEAPPRVVETGAAAVPTREAAVVPELGPASLPPTIITSTDACDPTRGTSTANVLATCEELAATQIAACDPVLGYRFHATMIQTLQSDGTYTNPVLNSVIACK